MKRISKIFKRFGVATTCAMSVVALASCGGSSNSQVIKFYSTMGDSLQTVANVAIQKFEAENPGWTIEHSPIGSYDDVRTAIVGDLQGNNQPAIAYCYADHVAQYLETGKVIDLNRFINDPEVGYTAAEVADFVQGYYKEGLASNYSGAVEYGYAADAMLTLPYVKSTEVLYYNKDVLDDLKISVPTTWDELWAACEKVKAKYPSSTPLGYDSEANWFITMCEQNGWGYTSADKNQHYLFNNSKVESWLNDLSNKYLDGLFTTQEVYGGYTSNLFVKGAAEGSVFSIGSSGGASHQASDSFTWGVAPVPGSKVGDTVVKKAISQGPSLVMFEQKGDNADEKELMSWKFVKELLDPTFQCQFSMASGYNPCRQSAFEVDEYVEFLKDTSDIVAVTAGVAKSMSEIYFTSPAFVGSSTARAEVEAALVYVVKGNKTAAKALQDAYKNCGGK